MSYKPLDRIGSRPMATKVTADRGTSVAPSTVPGMDYLRNPKLFKGMGFSLEERQALGKPIFRST